MKPIERSEILGIGEYETVRDRFRARVIGEKKVRRVQLGPRATCVFENRDTVLLQIQEMLRTERITRPAAVDHEIETYNALLPGERELSATVMVEIDDKTEREAFLDEARGMEKAVGLVVDGERSAATFDQARVDPAHLSAVLYFKFPLTERAAAHVKARASTGDAKIELVVDHAAYTTRASLPPETVRSLAEDLTS